MKHGQHASNEAWVARAEILGSMPAMKRARASLLSELLADTAEPDVVWQVCLQEAWRGKGPAADGVDAFSSAGPTWADLAGGWKEALELLHRATQFGEDEAAIWDEIRSRGQTAWPRARLHGLGVGASLVEYVRAPPGTREGSVGDIFQRNLLTGTERSVRRLWLHVGSLQGKVVQGGMRATPTAEGLGGAAASSSTGVAADIMSTE